jgi:Xaa-Pro aminopeptidase
MKNEIVKKQQEMMKREGIEALVVLSPENTRYASGTTIPSQPVMRDRKVICVTPVEGEPVFIVVNIEEEYAATYSFIKDVRAYNEFTENQMLFLADVLRELGLSDAKIGIELDFLPAEDFNTLQNALPNMEFIGIKELFSEMRMIKTKEEIEVLREIGHIAEETLIRAFEQIKSGMKEKDIASIIASEYYALGGERIQLLTVTSGERTSMLNASATDRVLKAGDLIRIDFLGTVSGYYHDICRMGIIGEPTEEHKKIWGGIVEGRKMVHEQIKAGANTKDIYDLYQDYAIKNSLMPINFVGHGLGLGVHEEPYIGKYGGIILKPNMVLCVEPIHVIPNKVGFQLEDQVLVTETGYELLTGGAKSEELIIINK